VWEPISEGGTRVWDAISTIADELAAATAPAGDLVLLWTYLASARDDEDTAARAAAALERFVAELDRGYEAPALFGGLAGAGWVAAHVADDATELLDVIDRRLIEMLERWTGAFDLITGVAGLGVYFLEREGAAAVRGRELVVAQLAATAEHTSTGATWHTRPELLIPEDRKQWPAGCYDCGVAHGVAGAIGVLARIAARSDAPAAAAPLAADGTRWLLAKRDDHGFPAMVHGTQRSSARDAWCYGAPGIALALGRADVAEPSLLAPRALDSTPLCHGETSLLHVTNRLYQATRDPRHRVAALGWLDRVLAAPRPTGASLLDGGAGIALALLATVTDLEPAWDRLLLCDAPTRAT
jgi:hypothetical protein